MASLLLLGAFAACAWLYGRSRLLALAPILLISCAQVKEVGGEVGGHVAEWIACPTDLVDCGHVYLFGAPADNALGHVELCVDDDDHPEDLDSAEMLYGPYEPTPRHEGLCLVHCQPGDGPGCNGLSGCYCPERS